ncbi:hypothetical protein PUNSTDRAFT_141205 [Punctularia strigosozonata HHB-11173 SS5]|uniref:uncharacterized protein n=1 Tax=Punctularia strigosozonata (strain HHB-11173) TaxID=741275 RepID=UPI0004417A2D|nr:uncharacterized protein PUNSTDRAFT_141205 [Punctularia strigosozonata HHB-11173 SS5]EIN12526.1 hypothetical protein PUNSTDRAFT_141205 [Punctularia strigosozonata HHB-11173 SS5]
MQAATVAPAMEDLDTSWCPVCSRQILPKRYTITIPAAPAQAPAAPPSSPSKTAAPAARPKTTNARPRVGGGLVHGTGRVKANGAIKSDAPAAPVKQRTVIDQSPVPLYCSDECRLADLTQHLSALALPHNYRPDETQPTQPATAALDVPARKPAPDSHAASSPPSAPSSASSSSTAASPRLAPIPVSSRKIKSISAAHSYDEMDPTIAELARHYGFPALPPPPPESLIEHEVNPISARPASSSSSPEPVRNNDYQSGIMMAARRIKAALAPPSPPKRGYMSPAERMTASKQARDRRPIPGWTDGTDAWRAAVYSMSKPRPEDVTADPRINKERMGAAYGSCVATPHRSTSGVYSTLSTTAPVVVAVASAGSDAPSARMEELLRSYPLSNAARSKSRQQLFPGVSQSVPAASRCPSVASTTTASTSTRRRDGLLPPSAEGKLLVPDIKMRRSSSGSSIVATSPRARAMLRRASAMSEEAIAEEAEDDACVRSLPTAPARTQTEPLYLFDLPRPMEKRVRKEKRIVDGVEVEVDVEYEVPKELKRLWLGPNGKSEGRERYKREKAERLRREQEERERQEAAAAAAKSL